MSDVPNKFPSLGRMYWAAGAVLRAVFASQPEIRRKEQNESLSN